MSSNILVVDDSLTVRMDLLQVLGGAGLEATACATIAEARAALRVKRPALVILDVLLPDGDGVDLLKEIRDTPEIADTPVVLLSIEAEVSDRVRGMRMGADEYLGKPYDPDFLVARARDLLQRRQEAPPAPETVLLIDDSLTFREALRGPLEAASYRVLTAGSGEEGLRIAAAQRPSAIVVDGELPGIDGASVIRRVRLDEALRATLCVLLTDSEDPAAELRALDSGADAFARTTEDIDVVIARLSALLRNAEKRAERPHARSLHAPRRILAVDNSASDLEAIAAPLRSDGYDVVLAYSGEAALDLLAVQPVDCVLLTLEISGTGGEETCRRIKAAPAIRNTPVVMIIGTDDHAASLRALGAGADDCIAKSSGIDVLRARVLAQMRRKQFDDEHRRIRDELLRRELEAAAERTAREVAEARASLVEELERKNRELEAFSYSVSHDLRAPLRSIDGFSQALIEDYGETLDAQAQDYLRRVRAAAQRMGELIDDLLQLSQVGRAQLRREPVDLSTIAMSIVSALRRTEPARSVGTAIEDGHVADGDPGLLQALLENLLGNAWKFTAKAISPKIEFGTQRNDDRLVYFVRDNGAGFDMKFADRLFSPFQRLHTVSEFPGTGIGLATVYRIVDRHGGRVWAEAEVGKGAAFYWTLPNKAGGKRP